MVAIYNEDGSVNVMNAAWGTMQERDHVVEADYFGANLEEEDLLTLW